MKIGITGHRIFDDKAVWQEQQRNVASWMLDITKKYPDATIITGGATGIDTIAAENAIKNNLTSKIILPMHPRTFANNWNKNNQKRLASILLESEVEIIGLENNWTGKFNPDMQMPADFFASMPMNENYEYELLQERNEAIVDQTSILLAFWDGRGKGGTYNCLKYALKTSPDELTVFNGISRETIHQETPLSFYFQTEEACIEGCERLQEKVGYEKYNQYHLSADYFSDNSNIFGVHEIVSDTEIDTGVAARVYASVSSKNPMIQKADAINAADLIVKFGIESERYWTDLMKADFNKTVAELQHLTDALVDCETPETDALMIKNFIVQPAYNDTSSTILNTVDEDESYEGVIPTTTYGFHRVNNDDLIEPETPGKTRRATKAELKRNPALKNTDISVMTGKVIEPDPRLHAKNTLLAQIRNLHGKELLAFGRNLHHQKALHTSLQYTDWTEIWTAYNDRKRNANITSENGFRGTTRPHPDYPQVRRGKQLWAVQFPSGKWEFAQKEYDTEENRGSLQLTIWDRLHADIDGTPFTIRNKQMIDYTRTIDACPHLIKNGKDWCINDPERQDIKAYFRQDEKVVLRENPFLVVDFLNDNFKDDFALVQNFDDAPNWVLEKAQGHIIIKQPTAPTPELKPEPIFAGREFFTVPLELIECFPKEYVTILFSEKPVETQIDYRTHSANPIIVSGHDEARQQAREFLLANGATEVIAPNRPEEQQRFRMKYCSKEYRFIY